MGKILCATRGGKASRATQDAAIALARDRGSTLIFIFVADVRFLDKTAAQIVVDVDQEVIKMGEFLLLMAQERAAAQGIKAQTAVRRGRLRTELVAAAKELDVDLIVLGRPLGTDAVFDDASLSRFAASLGSEAGVEVRIL